MKLERKSMTSFCRRVIAMGRIVANKRRIASVFADYYFDTGFEGFSSEGWMCVAQAENSHFEIRCAKFCKELLSDAG